MELNEDLGCNFVSYSYISKLQKNSEKPLAIVPAPPLYVNVVCPDGMSIPVRHLLNAQLEWSPSPDVPVPKRDVFFVLYETSRATDDAKLVLGRGWSSGWL
jgi:hypothetical protein